MNQSFLPQNYGPALGELITPDSFCPEGNFLSLGKASPQPEFHAPLLQLTLERAFEGKTLVDREAGSCCLAALWLLHDFLEEAHALCQEVAQPCGSYWHGIVHRREGDNGNAKYWFKRASQLTIFQRLSALIASDPLNSSLSAEPWDAIQFVDLCHRAIETDDHQLIESCKKIQQIEWQVLFDYCYKKAVGN